MKKVIKSDEKWRKQLSPAQFHILREKGTEPPFTGIYFDSKKKGQYVCAGCHAPLFSPETKFESGTGWPSFWEALPNGIENKPDNGFFLRRIEVVCKKCGGHLGHVFPDGPPPTGLRYCMNSLALDFKEKKDRVSKRDHSLSKTRG